MRKTFKLNQLYVRLDNIIKKALEQKHNHEQHHAAEPKIYFDRYTNYFEEFHYSFDGEPNDLRNNLNLFLLFSIIETIVENSKITNKITFGEVSKILTDKHGFDANWDEPWKLQDPSRSPRTPHEVLIYRSIKLVIDFIHKEILNNEHKDDYSQKKQPIGQIPSDPAIFKNYIIKVDPKFKSSETYKKLISIKNNLYHKLKQQETNNNIIYKLLKFIKETKPFHLSSGWGWKIVALIVGGVLSYFGMWLIRWLYNMVI